MIIALLSHCRYDFGTLKYLEMWSCTVLTYLERVFDSPHPEELLPSLELICTAIRQARVQPADKNRTGQDQSGLEKHNSIILFVDKAFEKSLLS